MSVINNNMKIIRNLHRLKKGRHKCVLTIGNFDGVHLGHQAVIRQLRAQADELNLPAVIMTFEPLPLEFFSPRAAPARLTDFREKMQMLEALSVDKVLCLRFNESLAGLSAGAFVKDLLIDGLGIRKIIVGDDFGFGKDRQGNVALLRELGSKHGFDVIPTCTYEYNGIRVSSSMIRGHLALGDFEQAVAMLGRPYQISGKVIHGDKRGRTLGFPTANIALKRKNTPLSGVFAVRVHGLGSSVYAGVASIGTRPVFNGEKMLLETFIFDFSRDIYGRRISIEFVKHLREEQNFASVEALCAQMEKDAHKAREFFRNKATSNK